VSYVIVNSVFNGPWRINVSYVGIFTCIICKPFRNNLSGSIKKAFGTERMELRLGHMKNK